MEKPDRSALQDFAAVSMAASRFLFGVANLPLFKASDVGFAHWLALCLLAESEGLNNKQLGRRLGASGQRLRQIRQSLVSEKLIEIAQPSEESRRLIRITPAGRARLGDLNSQLAGLIDAGLKDRNHLLNTAERSLTRLARIAPVPKIEKQDEIADGE